jgi:hypothetical protein
MQPNGSARSGIIAVVAAIICVGCYLLVRKSNPTSNSAGFPSQQGSDRGAPSREHLAWMDTQFEHDRSELLKYSATPDFAEYQAEILAFLNDAQKLYQHAHARYAAALQAGAQKEAFCYAMVLISAWGRLNTVADGLGSLSQRPESRLARDTKETMERVQNDYTESVSILAQYSQDSESVKKYRENPAELDGLLRSGFVKIEESRSLLEKNEVLGAWLSVMHADLFVSAVWERLLGFQGQKYQSRTTGRP